MTWSRKGKAVAALGAAMVLLAVAAFLFLREQPRLRSSRAGIPVLVPAAAPRHYELKRDEEHVKEVEEKMAPLTALFTADAGATPCETAYNSFKAFLDADPEGRNTTFALPARDVFLARCSKLTDEEQQCLSAAYQATHRDTCEPLLRGITPKVFDPAPNAPPPH